MHHLTLWQVNLCAWYVFLIVWGIAALKRKPDKAAEPLAARLLYGAYFAFGFALLFSHSVPFNRLYGRFMPRSHWGELAGVVITYLGVALAVWARFVLADNWSGRITVKVGHELMCSGPYAYVRHPIYSGILLSVIGTALQIGEWRGLVAIAMVTVAFAMKGKREEAYMTTEFGQGYIYYRRSTGFLVPKLSRAVTHIGVEALKKQ
ncbi:MAG TPA: isoprenylcysteine carboxylmethyltransferase family protein [Terriglobales bacterium]|nr:isoprenylcysteine carboxylmethyltransferase family protein [Terriglobales bacterium]